MAEENKAAEEEQPEKKKSKLLLFVIIGVVLAGGGAAAAFLLGGKDKDVAAGAGGGAEAKVAAVEEQPAGLLPLDTFLVNLNDSSGERYMKVTMRLTIAPESACDDIKEDDLQLARVRDRVLTVLMSKTYAELADPLGKESLRFEIQGQIDAILKKGAVRDVFFSEFVVQ